MMEDIKKLIEEILKKGYLMSLATQDEGGVWVADVIYIHDDNLNIYWISNPDVRHSRAISQNKEVAATITASHEKNRELGLQLSGTAARLGNIGKEMTKKYIKKNPLSSRVDEDFLRDDSWYVLKPRFVELINNELFGYDKKKLEL